MDTNETDKNIKIAFQTVGALLDQFVQAWEESRKISFPSKYYDIDSIVVCGMGGSSMPAHVVRSVFGTTLPLNICKDYVLPSWVDSKTLVVLSSYSGNTEEVLSCAQEAVARGSLITGLTTGGQLQAVFEEQNIPFYLFDAKYNYSGMPRFGIGYSMAGLLGILSTLGLVQTLAGENIDELISPSIEYVRKRYNIVTDSARDFALKMTADAFLVISSQCMVGNGLVFANQLNETSKRMAFNVELPEINHNLVEAFAESQLDTACLFVESSNYHPRVKRRFEITREILGQKGYQCHIYGPSIGNIVQEMFEALIFSCYCSVSLSEKNGIDPLAIPVIDYIKDKLLT